ncbi:hypothetical protein IIU_02687 [Bacillus cereus VD133]|uniref:DUF2513 domain-containing protein n=1 Tax=Bacillus cereus VD133 TaxID=1053233 RepID=A0A9W5PS54_BACCE|nr:DUF2513 domain-containing protein [Bacillus cereus]EOO33947.1 hypothetical protein IIU_02687 [Bacillus cereus VD133]
MKLNQDCVRDLLLELEEKLTINDYFLLPHFNNLDTVSKHGFDDTFYSFKKLVEANYLNGSCKYGSNELINLSIDSISWDGHQFLDTIRDNVIWSKTKTAASSLSSVSISIMSALATSYLKQQFGL